MPCQNKIGSAMTLLGLGVLIGGLLPSGWAVCILSLVLIFVGILMLR